MAKESRPRRVFEGTITVSGLLVGLAAFSIGVSVSYDVIGRTLFGVSTTGVTDVNTYIMGFITFVGAGYAMREDAHVRVDIVTSRLGVKSRRILLLISEVIVLLVTGILLWLGFELWWDAWRTGETSWGLFTVQLWIPYASLPIGMGLLFCVQIDRMMRLWREARQ